MRPPHRCGYQVFGTFSKYSQFQVTPNTSEGFQDPFKDFPGLSVQSVWCVWVFVRSQGSGPQTSSDAAVAGDGELGSNASPHRSRTRTSRLVCQQDIAPELLVCQGVVPGLQYVSGCGLQQVPRGHLRGFGDLFICVVVLSQTVRPGHAGACGPGVADLKSSRDLFGSLTGPMSCWSSLWRNLWT